MINLKCIPPALVILVTLVHISYEQVPPCPAYPSCFLANTPANPCDGTDQENPCPDGRSTCFEGNCCCIKYNPIFKHLVSGSSKPLRDITKLRTYYMRFCPFSHRVMLVTKAKNIPTDAVFVNLKNKPEWFVNPLGGKVPVIETEDGSINESLIEADYLDEVFPVQGGLYPAKNFLKAIDRVLIENFNKVMPTLLSDILYGKGFTNPAEVPALMKQFEDNLTKLGDELSKRGTKFFGGDEKPGMFDYMIWPWIERRPVLQMYNPNAYDYSKTSARLATWIEAMKQDEAVQTFGLSPLVHYEYAGSNRAGTPNYDMLAGI